MLKKLPTGIQNIGKILKGKNYVYVDKTDFVKNLIDAGAPHYFMSRPRRFGKSLFLDTLGEVFKGNKELFKNCSIYNSDYEWESHPVILIDFSQIANRDSDEFEGSLKRTLQEIATSYGISIEAPTFQEGLKKLIVGLFSQETNRVVVLIDEYDHPIINNLVNPEVVEKNRNIMKNFFGTLKGLDKYVRFTFVTGVTKFSQVSLFSGPNHLTDITMDSNYATAMGYTEKEVKNYFIEHIQSVADQRQCTEEAVLEELRIWYNGYRFSKEPLSVYNPYSTLRFLSSGEAKGYWYSSGTPSFLIDQLKKHEMISLDGTTATEEDLMDNSVLDQIELKALMYQAGYFTIQDYNPISKRYHLGLPNEEVRSAFIHSLVKNFASIIDVKSSKPFVQALKKHQLNPLFQHINVGFSSFAYQVFAGAKECTYQGMLLSMLYGMGFDPLSEQPTNTGRLDVVLDMPSITYLLELKLDGTAEAALEQIRKKEYFKPYTQKGKEIVLIGANFSSTQRQISEWRGELLSESGIFLRKLI